MKKKLWIVILTVVVLCAAIGLTAFLILHREDELDEIQREELQELEEHRGEYDEKSIVLYDTNRGEAQALAEKFGATLRMSFDGKFATLTLPGDVTIEDIYAERGNRKYISEMSADYQVKTSELTDSKDESSERLPTRPQYTVSDAEYDRQTYLDYLNLGTVWNTTKGNGITVAVIDTGIDTDHPEFAGRISEYSYNATEDKIVKDYTLENGSYDWSLIEDEQGHGTAVTGVIAASMNSGNVVGIAPSVTIITIKAECDENGTFARTSDLVFGLYYAIERDVSVVNMSFGTQTAINPFASATQLAVDSDIICVAATGNESTTALTYPAADENVFGVGALGNDSWELASYSNYGENVNFVAPGTTYTTLNDGKYGYKSGTSLAAPTATGAIALYLSQNKYSEFKTVEEVLYASCYDLGDLGCDWYYGYGALDISALILEERGTVTFNMMTDELENTEQLFIRNHTLQNIPEPERLYAIFDGWYYDPQCTEEYNWYADKFSADLTLYANWVNEDDGIPYTYVELEDGTIEIRSYKGHRRYITIPDTIDGKIVSSIGEGAFQGEDRLREVILPSQLKYIKRSAFDGCSNLLHIEIPDTVVSVGNKVFYDNVRLSYVAIGANSQLTSVGSFAFGNCSNLTRFDVPTKLTNMDGSVFVGTTSMTFFSVNAGNTAFVVRDGVLLNYTASTVVCYPAGLRGDYELPETVTSIGNYAFAYARLTEIDLSGVTNISNYAFVNASLESIDIPDSVTSMGDSVFANCFYLKNSRIGAGLSKIPDETFANCFMLESIEIPSNIRSIGGYAFLGTASLSTVTFAENSSLTQIGGAAFLYGGVRSVNIPASVIMIGSKAFASTSLTSVAFANNSQLQIIGSEAFAGDCGLTQVELPEQLAQIGAYAFQFSGLQTVNIPASVTYLGEGVFAACGSLTDITVADGNVVYVDIDGVVYDKAVSTLVAYPAGNARTSYTVQNGVVAIGEAAFYGSHKLNNIYLPDSLQEIRREAFYWNINLRSMQIPDNVTQISNYAFAEDWNLTSVTFGANSKLPRISYESFAYCGLTSFRVPANVSTMAQGAFKGCPKLTSFTFAANSKLESISAYMFDGCSNLRTITFENGSALTSIQAHGLEGMRKLTSINFGDAKLTNIDNFAFRFCESLTRFDVPNGVEYVGRYAFYYCFKLAEVTIPASVEYVGRFAFLGAENINVYFAAETLPLYLQEDWDHGVTGYYLGVTDVTTDGDWKYAKLTSGDIAIIEYNGTATNLDLTALDFGGDIVNIGGEALAYSTVETVTLPETLVTIQAEAFYHSNLKSVIIPESVQFIGRSAFADTPIQTLTFAGTPTLKVMEQSAFEGTKQLQGVTLPASLTTMGRAVFKNSGITSLTFAEGFSMTEIPEEAFAYTKITSVTIPDSVTLLNHGAFRETSELKSVTFGASDELMIMSNVFYRAGLENLTIPANVSYIGEYAFVALSGLENFAVDADNQYYKELNGLLVSKDGRKLIAVPAGKTGELTVPSGIEVIGFGAFEDSKLTRVYFLQDANILSFGYRAFYGSDLTEVEIPASVVAVDYYAFANCESLAKVTFAEGNQLRGIYEGAFYGCRNLKEITVPDTVAEISDFAFYGCASLTELPLSETSEVKGIYDYAFAYAGLSGEFTTPSTLYDIGAYAFLGNKFTDVTIPNDRMMELIIGIGAFAECNEIVEITVPFIGASFEDPDITWFGYIFGAGGYEANAVYVPQSLKKVTVTEGTSVVGAHAFDGLTMLTEMSIPHSVTQLEPYAFYRTTAKYELTNTILTVSGYELFIPVYSANSYHFGKGVSNHLTLSESLTRIESSVFSGCSRLESIVIPSTINTIESSTFSSCSSLKKVDVLGCIETIGSYAFSSCTMLENIDFISNVKTIDGVAFSGCDSLKKIVIPSGLEYLGYGAFSGCDNLESIVISEGIKSLASNLFRGCFNLKEVTLPNSLEVIGSNAFEECKSLEQIQLPKELTAIESSAFYNCLKLKEIVIPNRVTLIGSNAFTRCLALQKVVLSETLTSIGSYAFYECDKLTSIQIPDTVTEIGSSAFESCDGLSEITLSKNLPEIKSLTFISCPKLTKIVIPDNTTVIGDRAFESCSHLETITLSKNLTDIGKNAFYGCSIYTIYNNSDLTFEFGSSDYGLIASKAHLIVDKNGLKTYNTNAQYIDTEGGFRFLKTDSTYKLIAYWGDEEVVTLPTDIDGNSYTIERLHGVKHVIIPDGMTEISSVAFAQNTVLTSIVIPDSVKTIGWGAFSGCTGLKEITIPDSVKTIGWSAFSDCSSLETVVLPSGLETIDSSLFRECESLKNVSIPNTVKTIRENAFYGCMSLESISIPSSVTYVSDSAFRECTGLQNVVLNDNLTSIGVSAFDGCSNLTQVRIPSTVSTIRAGAFANCEKLQLTVDSDSPYYAVKDQVLYDANLTTIIWIPEQLTSICIPASVTNIASAFEGKTNLLSVTFESQSKLTEIGSAAFEGCIGLKKIVLPDSITTIGSRAFYGCVNLESVEIPNGVTAIKSYAFCGCENLANIKIPSGVTVIEEYTFDHCKKLTSIKLPDGIIRIGTRAFSYCTNLNEINIPNGVTAIPYGAFYNCENLTQIVIPNDVTTIGENAFSYCNNLVTVVFPQKLQSIGRQAFGYCNKLATVNLPEGLTYIGDVAFDFCQNLKQLTLPSTVKTIGVWAFRFSQLTSITIPECITSIGENAFYGCDKLYTVYNNSELELVFGSEENGYVAYYAKIIVDKNGNKTYQEGYIVTEDGFAFEVVDGSYKLVAYLGNEETVTLPESINGNAYTIGRVSGVRNVIVPSWITKINDSAFSNCDTLETVVLSEGITYIGYGAFANCPNLVSVVLPDSLKQISDRAFRSCSNLINITISDATTSILGEAFVNTAYYNDPSNWIGGGLYVGNHLLKVAEDTVYFEVREGTVSIHSSAFKKCYKLKKLTIGGDHSAVLSDLTNLETLVITEQPTRICDYFGKYVSNLPMTLKNIVLSEGILMNNTVLRDSLRNPITDVTIYVEAAEKDVKWDENFPNWHNGNKVVYGDEWITADFYGPDGNLISSEIFTTSQIIRQPYVAPYGDEQYSYVLGGWDLDGDGVPDSVPATSNVDISAKPIINRVTNTYTVTFYDKDNATPLYQFVLPYGTEITLPENPTKRGYEFLGWVGYSDGMTVTSDVSIYSAWQHDGEGHTYADAVWVDPTCTEQGYNKHECAVCGEWYGTDYVDALGHSHEISTIPPTCTEQGYDLYLCACGDSYRDNYVDALGHAWGEWIIDTPAECLSDGAQHRVCGSCFETEEQVINAIGHHYMQTNVIKEATCKKGGEGSVLYMCDHCGDEVIEQIPLKEHNYKKVYRQKSFWEWLIEKILNIVFGYEGDQIYFYECTVCGNYLTSDEMGAAYSASVKSVCDHSLGDWEPLAEVTCTTEGVEGRICAFCEKVIEARTSAEATGHSIGADGSCSLCDFQCPTFASASLTMEDNISVNFKIKPSVLESTGFTDPYVVYTFNGQQFTVKNYTVDSNGRYSFAFSDIAPRMMNDIIIATLYASYDGEVMACQSREYSVKTYCYNMLTQCNEGGAYANNTVLKTLLVDLLNYGAAAQIYGGYQVDNLVTADLTEAQRSWATPSAPELQSVKSNIYKVIDNPTVEWKAAGLLLEDSVTMRFKIATESTEGLKLHITTDTNSVGWYIDSSAFVTTTDGYYVYFDGLKARQMRETVYVAVYQGDTVVSNTMTYSIESYAYSKQNDSNAALSNLVIAMMKYGCSAEKYANR